MMLEGVISRYSKRGNRGGKGARVGKKRLRVEEKGVEKGGRGKEGRR